MRKFWELWMSWIWRYRFRDPFSAEIFFWKKWTSISREFLNDKDFAEVFFCSGTVKCWSNIVELWNYSVCSFWSITRDSFEKLVRAFGNVFFKFWRNFCWRRFSMSSSWLWIPGYFKNFESVGSLLIVTPRLLKQGKYMAFTVFFIENKFEIIVDYEFSCFAMENIQNRGQFWQS